MDAYTGQIAGLLTSVFWTITSVFFTLSGREVGSAIVNRTRLLLALVMVSALHLFTEGALLPVGAEPWRWGWFALSGLIGFVLGDALLFQAYVMIGPRLSMLLMALNPVIGAILAWLFLDERLSAFEIGGMLLVISGVGAVVTDPASSTIHRPDPSPRYYMIGIVCGLGGALGQAVGYIASKQGLADDYPALSGNLMRIVFATAIIWGFTAVRRGVPATFVTLRAHPRAISYILGGAIGGPVIGVTLSLIAVQKAPVGVASTLTSLMPIFLLPIAHFFFDERVTPRAIGGTLLAMAGTALLFLEEVILNALGL